MGFLIFFFLVTAVYSAAHYYLYAWFVRLFEPSKSIRKAVGFLFLFLVFSFPISRVLSWHDFNAFNFFLVFVASLWMGSALYLFLFALGSDLLFFLGKVFRINPWLPFRPPLLARRLLFAAILGGVLLIAGFAFLEARNIGVTRLEIPLANLPKELDGFSLVQISDFHYGVLHSNSRLNRVVSLANGLDPDVVFITGDMVDESVAHMEDMAPPLAKLGGKNGVYAVTGNHDHYAGVERATRILREARIRVLRNELAILPGGLQVLGIDDPTGTRRMGEKETDFESLLAKVDPAKPSILLYHQPVRFEKTAQAGIGLQLSGHTHGGQLYPVIFISRLLYPLTPGLHRRGNSYLYVSRGVGTWGPPMRFFSPPEIVHIRLVSRGK